MAMRFVAVLFLVLVAAPFASADDSKPALSKAKVGDYVVFKMIGSVPGTMRQEVTAVTDKTVTIKTSMTTNGLALPDSEQTVDIETKSDPAAVAKEQKERGMKIVDTGTGQETLTIGGKAYKCDWRANSITIPQGGMDIVSTSKVWLSPDAPVYGLVKTETTSAGQTTGMELTEAGSKP